MTHASPHGAARNGFDAQTALPEVLHGPQDRGRTGTTATRRACRVAVLDLLECVSGAGRTAARPRSYCASVRKVRSP